MLNRVNQSSARSYDGYHEDRQDVNRTCLAGGLQWRMSQWYQELYLVLRMRCLQPMGALRLRDVNGCIGVTKCHSFGSKYSDTQDIEGQETVWLQLNVLFQGSGLFLDYSEVSKHPIKSVKMPRSEFAAGHLRCNSIQWSSDPFSDCIL
jgi:hypothetical protein